MERRLAAILLTDMVSSSRLMGLDEEGTIARQKAHRRDIFDPKIAAYGGRIVKSTGDGLLVEFPSVVDAAKCAVEIQGALFDRDADIPEDQRIRYRIGINLGDIVIDGDDILGDGVNVAARLETLAKPGGVCISGTAHDHLHGKLDVVFQDAGEQTVRNVARPVHVWHWLADTSDEGRPTFLLRRKWPVLVATGLTLAILLGGLASWYFWGLHNQRAPPRQSSRIQGFDKPVIAVLPFDNLSQTSEQDYFSDGITQDLITDLSQIAGLFVIARHTTFTYKGTKSTVQQVARELNASHVLEGSVRKSGSRIRINATLIEARSGHQLWADRYDREISDVFALQDEVTRQIVTALSVKLKLRETNRLSRSGKINPEAYDLLLRGLEKYHHFTRETIIEAREYFERAITLEPKFARAHADLALTYRQEVQLDLSDDPKTSMRLALKSALRALELDETVREVHFVLANVYQAERQFEKALAAGRRAIDLDPNYADAYAILATIQNFSGNPRDAMVKIKKAIQLNPRHPYFYTLILGQSYYLLGRNEEALNQFEQVKRSNPQFTLVHKMLAATYVALGRTDDAEWAAAELLTLAPKFSIKGEAASSPYKDKAVFNLYIDRLHKAGLK